jgi:hypothetical protein
MPRLGHKKYVNLKLCPVLSQSCLDLRSISCLANLANPPAAYGTILTLGTGQD